MLLCCGLQSLKVVMLEDLAAHFKIKTQVGFLNITHK